jgi:hypothetical protein
MGQFGGGGSPGPGVAIKIAGPQGGTYDVYASPAPQGKPEEVTITWSNGTSSTFDYYTGKQLK